MVEPRAVKRAAALLLLALALAPRARAAGIYFQRDDAKPWQNCYAIPLEDALRRVRARDFKGAGLISIERVALEGETIHVSHRDGRGVLQDIALRRCPFAEEDRRRPLRCEVTVQTARSGKAAPLELLARIEALWRAQDPGARVIDCRAGTARSVRNSWEQDFTLADYKLIGRINELRLPLVPMTAFGTVSKGAGTNRLQGWRAAVGFEFMENRMQPEICDASVEELSIPGNLDSWVKTRNGGWCPWGLEIVSLSCAGLPAVTSAAAAETAPLDASSETAAYCAAR